MLRLENVHVYYGQVHALKGITGEVNEGELVAVLGTNGAGKSTTLMSVSGILKTRSGKIIYEETDLTQASPYDIVKLGVIQCPEGRHIFGGLTVRENLLMGAVQRRDRSEVKKDIDWVCSLLLRSSKS